MGVIRRSVSIGANAIQDDQLVADAVREQLRRASQNGMVRIFATESAVGLRLDIVIGDQVVASNMEPVIKAIAPIAPDDIVGEFPILAGELVSVPVRNTTAGALTLGYFLDVP